jgi:hypothetical protein
VLRRLAVFLFTARSAGWYRKQLWNETVSKLARGKKPWTSLGQTRRSNQPRDCGNPNMPATQVSFRSC